jgi:hypothetical protein
MLDLAVCIGRSAWGTFARDADRGEFFVAANRQRANWRKEREEENLGNGNAAALLIGGVSYCLPAIPSLSASAGSMA